VTDIPANVMMPNQKSCAFYFIYNLLLGALSFRGLLHQLNGERIYTILNVHTSWPRLTTGIGPTILPQFLLVYFFSAGISNLKLVGL
jgi:hypothetical protein